MGGVANLFQELADSYLMVGPDGKGRGVWTAMGYILSNRKLMVMATHRPSALLEVLMRRYSASMPIPAC